MKQFKITLLAYFLCCAFIYTPMVAQNSATQEVECQYFEPLFISDLRDAINTTTECSMFYMQGTDAIYSSAEGITSHRPDEFGAICNSAAGSPVFQSARFIDLQPGFLIEGAKGMTTEIVTCSDSCTGNPCDDGIACTINDVFINASCECAGTPAPDVDGDGICDIMDQCPGFDDALDGTSCDDGDVCTINDVYDCSVCAGIAPDSDGDGVIDCEDQCPGFDDALDGTSCDDGDVCTINDVYNCSVCAGIEPDSDSDGVIDCEDQCPGFDDALDGASCDDGDVCTINDVYNCSVCTGIAPDSDVDGVIDCDDICPGFDDSQNYMQCDDGDPCTIDDRINCGPCEGRFEDSDRDGICNFEDDCPYGRNHNIPEFTNLVSTINVPQLDEISGLTFNFLDFDFVMVSDDGTWIRGFPGNWTPGTFNNYSDVHCSNTQFSDVEGVTFMYEVPEGGAYRYAIADERDRSIVFVDIPFNDTEISHSTSYLKFSDFSCGGNNGIEGLAYDNRSNTMYFATEHTDQKIYSFVVPDVINGQTIDVNTLVDLRDVPGLSTFSTHGLTTIDNSGQQGPTDGNVIALVTKPENGTDNGLFERMIVEFDACGNLLGQLNLEPIIPNSAELEGIMWVRYLGTIWITGELGVMYELSQNASSNFGAQELKSLNSTITKEKLDSQLEHASVSTNTITSVYPNPFIDQAKVEIDLVANERVRIDVIDLQGKLVKTAVNLTDVSKGHHVFDLDADDINSGLYFIRVQIGDFVDTKKITKL